MTPLAKELLERLVTEAFLRGQCHARGQAQAEELRQARESVRTLSEELFKKERESL